MFFTPSRKPASRPSLRPTVESLETRNLLSITFASATGIITVDGDNSSDSVTVSTLTYGTANPYDDVVWARRYYGSGQSYNKFVNLWTVPSNPAISPIRNVKRIHFFADNGTNSFDNQTDIPSSAYGGSGFDLFRGGSDSDYFVGYGGNDHLYGRGGDDILEGGEGHDWIWGGDGNDILRGSTGNDRMYGEAGDDYLEDGVWEGEFWFEGGNDSLYGGDGVDELHGGVENDYLDGGQDGDADLLYGEGGFDTFKNEMYFETMGAVGSWKNRDEPKDKTWWDQVV